MQRGPVRGFGPYLVGISIASSNRIEVFYHTDPVSVVVAKNVQQPRTQSTWHLLFVVGPFQRERDAADFCSIWCDKVPAGVHPINWGVALFLRYYRDYRLALVMIRSSRKALSRTLRSRNAAKTPISYAATLRAAERDFWERASFTGSKRRIRGGMSELFPYAEDVGVSQKALAKNRRLRIMARKRRREK